MKFPYEGFHQSIACRFNLVVEFHVEQGTAGRITGANYTQRWRELIWRCIPSSTRNQSNAWTRISSSLCRWQWAASSSYVSRLYCTAHRIGIHFMKAIPRAYLSNQDINGESGEGGRFRSMITASTVFCFACNVIDYRPTENAPRFNCLDCRGKRFSSFISHCGRKTQSDITFRIHYRSNVKNNRLQI